MAEICDRCGESCRALRDVGPEMGRALRTPPPVRRDAVGRATDANEWRALRWCGPCRSGRALRRGSIGQGD